MKGVIYIRKKKTYRVIKVCISLNYALIPFFLFFCPNSLIPHKMMHDWKELFFSGNPIYEHDSLKNGHTESSAKHIELQKRNLLDKNDYEDYKVHTNME